MKITYRRALFTPKFDFGFGSSQHRIELEYVGYGLDISQYCIGLKCNGYRQWRREGGWQGPRPLLGNAPLL